MGYEVLLESRGWREYLKKSPPNCQDPTLDTLLYLTQGLVGNPLLYPADQYSSGDPLLYELGERIRPDEMKAFAKMEEALKRLGKEYSHSDDVTALDINCGTGLSTRLLAKFPWIKRIIGADIGREFLNFNKLLLDGDKRVSFLQADTCEPILKPKSIDLGVLSWAYHHIEDDKKVQFLSNLHAYLKDDGKVIVLEIILPHYTDEKSREEAVEQIYGRAIEDAKKVRRSAPVNIGLSTWNILSESNVITGLCEQSAAYEQSGVYEYKVHYNKLQEDFDKAGFEFVEEARVWPEDNSIDKNAGIFVFVIGKKDKTRSEQTNSRPAKKAVKQDFGNTPIKDQQNRTRMCINMIKTAYRLRTAFSKLRRRSVANKLKTKRMKVTC